MKEEICGHDLQWAVECMECGETELLSNDGVDDALSNGTSIGWIGYGMIDDLGVDGPLCPHCAKKCDGYWRAPEKKDITDNVAYVIGEHFTGTAWVPCRIFAIASLGEVTRPYLITLHDVPKVPFASEKVRVKA